MSNAMQQQARVLLLREVATTPVAALFVAERPREEHEGGVPTLAAVKVLKRPIDPRAVVGLQEHSARLAALNQRHIVVPERVLNIDGRLGLLSPFIEGVDLLDWLEVLRDNDTPMPPRVVCEVLRAVAVALDAALNRIPWGASAPLGILHCDLKPTNIMIDRDGELKVLDFGTGASRVCGGPEAVPRSPRSGRSYLAPERLRGRSPSHAGDVYALGLLGLELFANRWLRNVPRSNPEHDLFLGETLKTASLGVPWNPADEQTLKSLLLRMAAYSAGSRPTAAGAAQTLRRLADRAPGPSLESFAHEHALPWLHHPPENPDTALMVQATPFTVDVTGVFPRFPAERPEFGENTDEVTNTMSFSGFIPLQENDPTHVFYDPSDAAFDETDDTETIAEETAEALARVREERSIPVSTLGSDPGASLASRLPPTEVEERPPNPDLDPTVEPNPPHSPYDVHDIQPSATQPSAIDFAPAPAGWQEADYEEVVSVRRRRARRLSADEVRPRRSVGRMVGVATIASLAMLTGSVIAVGALLLGTAAGIAITTALFG
jgi:serine/threonine protein kinase